MLKLIRLWERGQANARDFECVTNLVTIANLPSSIAGYRILHLTDMHLGVDTSQISELPARLGELEYDLCVFTGDFEGDDGRSSAFYEQLAQLLSAVSSPKLAVLGNHDSISLIPWLEARGCRVLMNESATLNVDGATLTVAGVDDYHYFRLANLEKAVRRVAQTPLVLLNHSPEQYREAALAGVDLYLAGHTHGGQICLPGGYPPILNIDCSRKVGSGAWSYRDMQGYTSRGTGTSMVDVRFWCPPEIVVHELLAK